MWGQVGPYVRSFLTTSVSVSRHARACILTARSLRDALAFALHDVLAAGWKTLSQPLQTPPPTCIAVPGSARDRRHGVCEWTTPRQRTDGIVASTKEGMQ